MAGQGVNFDFTSRGADQLAGDFRKTGDSAALAAKGARLLSDALEKQRKATDVSAGATLALAKADKILADAEHTLADGALEAEFALKKEADAAQKAGRANEDSAAKTGGLAARMSELAGTGGIPGGGMGAAIAAGAALSPIIVTLGFGLGGLGLAAAGIIKPIENAAKKTGGLQANLKLLDPEQRRVALGLLGLGAQFHKFENQLQPVVLGDFNAGLRIAGHLLHDIQPVSIATGKALGGVLGNIDKEFQSGTWQQFFGFMARTAGPDTKQLGDLFTSLLHSLPPLLEGLQPIGSSILTVGTDAAKALGPVGQLLQVIDQNNRNIQGGAKGLDAWSASLLNKIPGLKQASGWITSVQHGIQGTGNQAKTAGPKTGVFGAKVYTTGQNAGVAGAKLQTMANAVTALNTAESTSLNNQLAYTNALLASKQGAIDLRTALKASGDKVGYHTSQERNSFAAANTYIGDLITTASASWKSGHGTDGAATAIRNALPLLDKVKTKNRDYWMELRTLKGWLDKLNAEKQIHDVVKLSGNGSWTFGLSGTGSFPSRHIKGRAAGWLVPGHGSGDTVPAMLTPGEAVVPRHLTAALAPFLSAHKVPGFASGGLVPSYSGHVAGLKPWGQHNFDATLTAMTQAFAAAGKAQQAALFSSVSGPASFGVTRWAPTILKVLAMLGQSSANLGAVEHRMQQESGGNPFAINLTDSNARAGDPSRGLMQTIGSTFAAYRSWSLPDNIYNPISNIFAGLNYAEHAYPGRSLASVMLQPGGYAGGTSSAAAGWAVVGERGPELLKFRGGEQVRPAQVIPHGRSGGAVKVELMVRAPHGATEMERAIVAIVQRFVTVSGGGDVQSALGRT